MRHESAPEGALAGRYRLVEEIGRGRSVVYRARDTRLGRDVAVKKVDLAGGPSSGDADDLRSRALREARASARITSPFVVGVYDVVEESDAVWLVMELVRAPSLAQVVAEHGPLDERRTALIGLGVLDALRAAHAEAIVHRDVKPGNVLVGTDVVEAGDVVPPAPGTPSGAGSPVTPGVAVKLADFGVAALRDETSVTSPGAVIGSPSYMSPEQASGRPVGPAADLWALGALLYFAVEGQPPYLGDSPLATATAVVVGEPRPQARPGQLSRLIGLLLDKDPERRPGSERVRAMLRSVAGDPDIGEVTGPAAAPAADPVTLAASARTLDGVGAPSAGSRPMARRLRWAAVAAFAVVAALALQLSGGSGGSPEVEADDVEVDAPAAVEAPPTTPTDRPEDGVDVAQPEGRDDSGSPARSSVIVPDTAPPAPAPGPATTAAPPETTTSVPPSTTTTSEPPEPEVTTPPTTDPATSTTTSTTVPSEPTDAQAQVTPGPVATETGASQVELPPDPVATETSASHVEVPPDPVPTRSTTVPAE